MTSFLVLYRRVLRMVGFAEKTLGVLLLLAIVVSILCQVYCRYILNSPLIWVLEASVNFFIWSTFLGTSYGLKLERHITINTFLAKLPNRTRSAMLLLVHLVILATSLTLAWYAFQVIGVESRTPTVSLPITLPRSWFFSVPVFSSSILMSITSIYNCLNHFHALCTGNEPEPVYA